MINADAGGYPHRPTGFVQFLGDGLNRVALVIQTEGVVVGLNARSKTGTGSRGIGDTVAGLEGG